MEMKIEQTRYQMLRSVEGFGVIFGQWRRNITKVRSGCLSYRMKLKGDTHRRGSL